jgi:hypothetical protein
VVHWAKMLYWIVVSAGWYWKSRLNSVKNYSFYPTILKVLTWAQPCWNRRQKKGSDRQRWQTDVGLLLSTSGMCVSERENPFDHQSSNLEAGKNWAPPEVMLQAWDGFWDQDWWVSNFNYPQTVLMALGVSYCYSDTWEHGIFPLKCQLSLSTSANPSAGSCRIVEWCSLMVWSKPIRSRAFYLAIHDCSECWPAPSSAPKLQGASAHSAKEKD